MTSDALPELTYERLESIDAFPAFNWVIDREMVSNFMAITGDNNPLYADIVPPGFAVIFGRSAYLRDYQMPPGGVLLREDVTWFRPAQIGEELTVQARVEDRQRDGDRRKVTLVTTATSGGEVVAEVRIVAGWPT